jgi:hypothetical protein
MPGGMSAALAVCCQRCTAWGDSRMLSRMLVGRSPHARRGAGRLGRIRRRD